MGEVGAEARPATRSLTDPLVVRWTALLVVARAAMVALVVLALGDKDFSRDLIYHFQLAELPLRHLQEPSLPQYPPLLGLAEAIPYRPLRMLGVLPPTALRVEAVVWDVVAGWFVLATVSLVDRARVPRAGLIYAAVPLTWIASALFAQDELIGAAFVAAGLWCVAADRRAAARWVGIAGLFVAKLLIAPFLVALVMAARPGRRRYEAALILGATAAVAAVLWALTGNDGLTSQLDYRPEWITFSVTPWGWLVGSDIVSSHTAQVAGQVLAAVAVGLLLVRMIRSPADDASASADDGTSEPTVRIAEMTAALLLAAFACLAVVNPEYVALAAPALVVAAWRRRDLRWLVGVTVIPWIADAFFAVIRQGPRQDWPVLGRFTIDQRYFDTLQSIQLAFGIATSLVLLGLAVSLERRRAPAATPEGIRPLSLAGAQPPEDEPATTLELRN